MRLWTISRKCSIFPSPVDSLCLPGRILCAMMCKIRRKGVSVAFQLACSSCSFRKLSGHPEGGTECANKCRRHCPLTQTAEGAGLAPSESAETPTDLPNDIGRFEQQQMMAGRMYCFPGLPFATELE